MNFPPQQEQALHTAGRWMRDASAQQVLYMGGYAGTGKTTLARHLVGGARKRWLFAAMTGKATHVMRQKGCHGASTIHSLIYRPNGESKATEIKGLEIKLRNLRQLMDEKLEDDARGEVFLENQREELRSQILLVKQKLDKLHSEREPMFAVWENSPLADFDVEGIVIDECSMVDDQLGTDLESFGKKILVLGDPFQLPPVGAGGRYTKRKPDITLTEVHRQAKESPILELATLIREGGNAAHYHCRGGEDCQVLFRDDLDQQEIARYVISADQVIVGRNATRKAFNHRHRELLGHKTVTPQLGDRLVCLRNNRALGIYNGSQWTVISATSDIAGRTCDLEIRSEDDGREVIASSWLHHMIGEEEELTQMGWDRRDLEEFDYGYSLTGHKAQGSQWTNVTVFDESRAFGRDVGRRWLYTSVTRASKKLTVIL